MSADDKKKPEAEAPPTKGSLEEELRKEHERLCREVEALQCKEEAKASAAPPTEAPVDSKIAAQFHGYLGDPTWPLPKCTAHSNALARPHYSEIDASEFIDLKEVLAQKAKLFASLVRQAQEFAVYTGAGLSTAAGIGDYASKASSSVVQKESCGNRLHLQPTYAHRVLVALEHAGHLKHWLQQNHDGLAQKAGYPFEKINEIHGSWFDPRANPVVLMDGDLLPELMEWLLYWEGHADMVLAVGTSLCGMNADRMAMECAKRHMQAKQGQGLTILNLQRTPYDSYAALRVFAKCDDFMKLVAKEMKLKVDPSTYDGYPSQEARKQKKRLLRGLGIGGRATPPPKPSK